MAQQNKVVAITCKIVRFFNSSVRRASRVQLPLKIDSFEFLFPVFIHYVGTLSCVGLSLAANPPSQGYMIFCHVPLRHIAVTLLLLELDKTFL